MYDDYDVALGHSTRDGDDKFCGVSLSEPVHKQRNTLMIPTFWFRAIAWYQQVTAPLVSFYDDKGVLKTFKGTMSDVIYPEVKEWLEEHA